MLDVCLNVCLSVYSFYWGTGFEEIEEEDAIQKIEEQIGKSKVIDHDPTPTLLSKFQKELAKLRKGKKFDNKRYFKLYLSDALPSRLYGVIKAHQPEKNYPMRTIVSSIGTALYGASKYLAEIIQHTLNKNKDRVMNSSPFVNKEEIQASYDVINLYPSIPIDKAFNRHFKKWLGWSKHSHKINNDRYTQINGTLLKLIIFSLWKQN